MKQVLPSNLQQWHVLLVQVFEELGKLMLLSMKQNANTRKE